MGWAGQHAVELDGRLIPYGRRFRDLTVDEVCSFSYMLLCENRTKEDRAKLDAELMPDEDIAEEFDWLPEGLRGQRPPAGWIAAGRT